MKEIAGLEKETLDSPSLLVSGPPGVKGFHGLQPPAKGPGAWNPLLFAALDILLLSGILAFLLDYFSPSLLLTDSVPAGGDTPSHFYTVRYLADVLLPQGRLSGWCPGALAGFPILQYYFPLPFVLAAALGKIVSLAAGFKIATAAGTFLLPLSAYGFFRLLRAPFPAPVLSAALSLCFLFNEGNTMWGGNIASTLAGEFCFSLSLALVVLWLGLVFHETASGRRRAVLPHRPA